MAASIMKGLKAFLSILIFFICTIAKGQELPPIQNYTPNDYKAENQNWSITQSSDKLIYVANSSGLLEFNGASWKIYPTPNGSIMRSVKAVENRIYSGCYMDFGYWTKNNLGELEYTSISNNTGIKLIEDESFWNITKIDDWILFQSLNRIYIYDSKNKSTTFIDPGSPIVKMYTVEDSIYFQCLGKGIYKIENGKEVLVIADDLVKDLVVVNIFNEEKDMLIQTRDKGFFHLKNNELTNWTTSSTDLLHNVSIYNSIRLRDNSFAIGTISDGIVYLNEKGNQTFKMGRATGLLNNTVLSLFEDIDNNIWLALDNGVSYINVNSPFRENNDINGKIGSVYSSAIFRGKLYLGSNQGLFYKGLHNNEDFSFIEGTEGQVWCLKEINNTLFCGHDSGTFIVNDTKANKISSVQGTWDIKQIKNKDLLLQGNYDGLYVLERKNGRWKIRNKIKNFGNSSRYFVEMPNNEIFINHEYKGVFKLKVDTSYSEAMEVTIDSVTKGANSCIIKYNQDLLYSYKEGIFKFDTLNRKFVKDTLLSKVYDGENEFISGKLLLDRNTNNLWGFTRNYLNYISPGELTNTPKINRIPLSKVQRKELIGYENMLHLNDNNNFLFGNYSGYFTIDVNQLTINDFKIDINRVAYSERRDKDEEKSFLDKNLNARLKNKENNIELSFYTPEFNKYLKTAYQYQLIGIYDEWSNWSENSTEQFENLPYGDYTFKVRSRIGNKISSNVASYSFEIEKPWFATNLMKVIYITGIILFLLLMHTIYRRYYKKKQHKLLERKNREIKLAQVENEKEIIRIKNEQLQLEFKNKSKELAASTMSIIKKNELLTTIKNELKVIKNESVVKTVISIIDKSLKQNDDWEFFQEAFNNADSGFLQKVKSLHSNLTPNDLRLCAYLRLNLSSKEIAPLLNISTRSVEVKRYRLRKKMSLPHENSLAEYILNL